MPNQKKEKKCENCEYFHFEKCKRYPPDPKYSDVSKKDWCGEFKRK